MEAWRYWSALDVAPQRYCFEDARETFDELMNVVMREHLRSDVPYGLFLSGGADSAALLALLTRAQERPIQTFSVGYTGVEMKDELADADRIARHFNARHTPLTLDLRSLFRHLPHTVWAADDLMLDYACLPMSILAERAGQELKVVFTGEGGDEVFAGYGRYRASPAKSWLKNLTAPGCGRLPYPQPMAAPLDKPGLRAGPRRRPGSGAATLHRGVAVGCPEGWSALQRRQYVDIRTALPDNLLVKVDRMLMAFGVEGRVPFSTIASSSSDYRSPTSSRCAPGMARFF